MKIFISMFLVLSVFAMPCFAQQDADTLLRKEANRQTASIRQGGSQWPVLTTEFFNIHYQPETAPDSVACSELDAFVEAALTQLDDSSETTEMLRKQKLSYYLCDSPTVEKLTGYSTKGMADLAGRAVISSHFPHFHELAHLLVDVSLKKPALQTHPLLQEGIACLLGGRWGRAPETILYTGWVHASFEMGTIDDVMTRDDFFTFRGGPDVAYPLGAALCEVVRREAGYGGVMKLYENLSGSVQFVGALTEQDVLHSVAEVCQWQAKEAKANLNEAVARVFSDYRRCGIGPVESELWKDPEQIISLPGGQLKVWKMDGRCRLEVVSDTFPVYLVSPASGRETQNPFFSEHLAEEPFRGQRYGLRCSPNDVALYDFATNQLLATWVSGFTDEAGACDAGADAIVFEMSGTAAESMGLLTADGCKLLH